MDDIIFNVYMYLPLKEIYHCMQVNKQCYVDSQQPHLWGLLLESEFGDCYKKLKLDTLYETYKLCIGLNKIKNLSHNSLKNISEMYDLQSTLILFMLFYQQNQQFLLH